MSLKSLKQRIRVYADTIGVHKIGFTHAAPFYEEREYLLNQLNQGWTTGFEEPDIDKRVYPRQSLADVESIISIAIAYPSRLEKRKPRRQEACGQFCAGSWGKDYHIVLQEKLRLLQAFLEENIPDVHVKIMVDTGSLSDRAIAKRAGLGFIGKNGALITEEYGSFVYLGAMLTNIPFTPDEPKSFIACGTCVRCIQACPAQAILGYAEIHGQKCLSYVTQKKTVLTDDEKVRLGGRLYGCDTCQEVCPKNKALINRQYDPEFEPEMDLIFPSLSSLYAMTNRQFKSKYGHMAGAWRGRTPIQRNAIIIAGKRQDPESYSLILELFQSDGRPTIREAACWALGRYRENPRYTMEIDQLLAGRYSIERDEEVRQAIWQIMKRGNESN